MRDTDAFVDRGAARDDALPDVPAMVTRERAGAHQTSLADLTPLVDTTFVVVDLETTGLSPVRDRITEIGAVRARAGSVEAELRTFVHPGQPIPAAVTAITGITDADVAHAPSIEEILPMLVDFIGGAVLVAHNAPFDVGFITAAAGRLGIRLPRLTVLDTAVLARRLIRDEVRDVRLGTLARHLRAPTSPDHRALNDARATLHVLHALIERAGPLGATSLEDLVTLGGPTGDRTYRRIDLVRDAPSSPGVYRFLAADGEVLYVGKATDLRRRLRSYFGQDTRRRTADLVAATGRVEWTVTATELEASVLEVRELQAQRPRYNRRSTRSGGGTWVTLTSEPFPRLAIVRAAPVGEASLGPVPRSTSEQVIEGLESVFRIRPCRPRLRRAQDNDTCMLKDLHRCDAVCDGTQTPDAYAEVVAEVRAALTDPSVPLPKLHGCIEGHARDGEFERAAAVREQLHALVRAFEATRRTRALSGVVLVAMRSTPAARQVPAAFPPRSTPVELAAIEDGRLVATAAVPTTALEEATAGLLRLLDDATAAGATSDRLAPREELGLIATWLEADDVRLVRADGELASPLAGGAALAATSALLRDVQRSLRSDDTALERRKVRQRSG
jgi:DNA polymerase III subunit epsilon